GSTTYSSHPTVGPASGPFYAVSDQQGPGTHALIQNFTVPGAASSVVLTFQMFVNQYATGTIVGPQGLDYTGGANEHARVDLLFPPSTISLPGPGALPNRALATNPGTPPNASTPYSFNITSLVGGGGTFRLRFAESDNQGYLNQGVDSVSIDFTAVPEPS